MSTGKRLAGLLLLTTSLTFPTALYAQSTDQQQAQEADDELIQDAQGAEEEAEIEQPEVSVPGGGIIVTGRRNRNPERSSTQVLNVLSEADIARTGEGDIAGALGRVTGLSVVGDGRVFVRGLGKACRVTVTKRDQLNPQRCANRFGVIERQPSGWQAGRHLLGLMTIARND